MKKNFKSTFTLCTIFFLFASAGFSQITINSCINFKQICPDCNCLMVWDPVCGCDGNTYSNACVAYNSGVTSWTEGACGSYSAVLEGEQRPDLAFHSGADQEVLLQILDESGNVVATPLNGRVEAGMDYPIAPELPKGTYTCKVTTENEVLTQEFTRQ